MEEKIEDLEFKWGKKRGIGGKKKDVQFYESFTYDGLEYSLYDSVYMHKDGEPEPFIGKIIKIWENSDKSKKVKIQWFFRQSEILHWLGGIKTQENEIFFASGDGSGLANVNPLEAIGGKCNVVCVSKDNRNAQLSVDELQKADYIFYRTFDVEKCNISDKIGDNVGGLEVQFVFNRKQSNILPGFAKLEFKNNNAIACNEKPLLVSKCPFVEAPSLMPSSIQILSEKANEICGVGSNVDCNGKTTVNIQQSGVLRDNVVRNEVENDNNKIVKNVEQGGDSSYNIVTTEVQSESKEITCQNVLVDEVEFKFNETCATSSCSDRVCKTPKVDGNTVQEEPKNLTSIHKSSMPGNDVKVLVRMHSNVKEEAGCVNDSTHLDERAKRTKDASAFEDRPTKKSRVDSLVKLFDDTRIKNADKMSANAINGAKSSTTLTSQGKTSVKYSKDFSLPNKSASMEDTLDKNSSMLRKRLPIDPPVVEVGRIESGEFEVTRRPTIDKSKWFRESPWKTRIQRAHEVGTLVVLGNLDPDYTSKDVEDIIWHAFQENCSAKMIQQTASSCPHSGQVVTIFKTKDAANKVVKSLNDGCLLLPNNRPLIGCSSSFLKFSGKHPSFFGHLSVDKLRLLKHRDIRDAVSTSHHSQPNTIEYEMAMEWCLLQFKSEKWSKLLYEKQKEEMRKLAANFKEK